MLGLAWLGLSENSGIMKVYPVVKSLGPLQINGSILAGAVRWLNGAELAEVI